MPKGEFLFVEIGLWPFQRKSTVNIIKIIELRPVEVIASVDYHKTSKNTWTDYHSVIDNPNQFNVYSVEWNETAVIFKFNSRQTLIANLEKIYPELNEMHLSIKHGVGGRLFDGWPGGRPDKDISLNKLRHWNCPSLLVDYVRYYKWLNEGIPNERVIKEENPSKESICMALEKSTTKLNEGTKLSENTKSNNTDESNSSILLIVIIVLSVFMTIVLILCIGFYSKYKTLRQNTNAMSDGNAVYDQVNYYVSPINVAYYDGVINSPSTPNNDYLEMTK